MFGHVLHGTAALAPHRNAIVARALILLARPMVPLQYVFHDQTCRHRIFECVGEINRSWLHMSCIVSLQSAWSLESCNTYDLAGEMFSRRMRSYL